MLVPDTVLKIGHQALEPVTNISISSATSITGIDVASGISFLYTDSGRIL